MYQLFTCIPIRQDKMATNITFHEGAVSDSERSDLLKQKGATIWLTGLSASGKVSQELR